MESEINFTSFAELCEPETPRTRSSPIGSESRESLAASKENTRL